MADLSVMGFLNEETQQETEYNLKDAQARSDIGTINGKIGSANGIAELDGNGLVPVSQLPSYVDDVLEGTAQNVTETSAGTFAATGFILKGELVPCTPEDGKTYVDTTSNIQYRWTGSGTNFVSMGSNLTLGETANTAYAGNKGKANADAIAAMKDGSSIDSFGDVETALAGKVDKVTGKGLSTNDYDNTAKGIVTTAQDNIKANTKLIKDTVGWSRKNKLQSKLASNTLNGVTFTHNSDDTWSVSGTATADTWMNISGTFKLPEGKYILNGCPQNGSVSSYRLYIREDPQISGGFSYNDYGNGVEFTITSALAQKNLVVFIAAMNGTAITTPIVFKPMLRDANILDDTYEPYFGSTAFPRSEQAVLGAKNLIKYPYAGNKTDTVGGVTYTYNDDGTIKFDGTALSLQGIAIHYRSGVSSDSNPIILPAGTYKLSKNSNQSLSFEVYITVNNTKTTLLSLDGNTNEGEFTLSSDTQIGLTVLYPQGAVFDNFIFKPMLRLATDPDNSYAPYAMTNKELTPHENTTDGATTSFTFDTNGKTLVKQGNIVVPYLRVTGVTVTGYDMSTPICVLADGYKPKFNRIIPIIANGQIKMATIYTEGKIVCTENLTNVTVTIVIPWTI